VLKGLFNKLGLGPKGAHDPATSAIDQALQALRAERPFTVVEVPDALTRRLVFEGRDGDVLVSFENFWRTWQGLATDGERRLMLRQWAGSILDQFQDQPATAAQLVPLIRHMAYAKWDSDMLARAKGWTHAPADDYTGTWALPFSGDLVIMLALDLPNSLQIVDMAQMQDLGVAPNEAIRVAKSNLAAILPRPQTAELVDMGLSAMSFPQTEWATPSALLFPEMLDQAMAEIGCSSALFALPARSDILFCDASRAGAMGRMTAAVATVRQRDHRQSDFIFRRDTGATGLVPVAQVPEDAAGPN
jgi:hypothetical protein